MTTTHDTSPGSSTPWTVELERLLVQALQQLWASCNVDHFRNALHAPVLALDDARTRLGAWTVASRTLTLSRPLVRTRPWHVVREVMKHEMAHQYVHEVLGVLDEAAHGPAFARVCAERGIDARATGLPDDDTAPDDDAARVMRRVQKLLALAQSSNLHEAEAAAQAAQRLMLEHNLAVHGTQAQRYTTRILGVPVPRMAAHDKMLAGLLSRFFFVDVVLTTDWLVDEGRAGTAIEVSGTRENLAMAQWVHAFLLGAGERAFLDLVKHKTLQRKDRARFLVGFMKGVGEKLEREQQHNVERGLVWVGDADLADYVRSKHPRLRAARVRTVVDHAHAQGRQAGNDVVIARPLDAAGASRGRMLGPRR